MSLERGSRKGLVSCIAITMLVLLLLLAPAVASATALPSKIKENTTLTAAGNPYTGSTVTVESGATLKVEPGVKFLIYSLIVYGTLDVDGTAEEPVVFTGSKEKAAGEWSQIAFESGSGASLIDHTEVKYGGGGNIGAIYINGSSPRITNSTISKSYSHGINIPSGGSPEIDNNEIVAAPATESATRPAARQPAKSTSTTTTSKAAPTASR